MKIAIVTFDGFNEIDSFVALRILNMVKLDGWKAEIVAPTETIISGNGVVVHAQKPLAFANEADVVLFGSGKLTSKMVADTQLMANFQLDPTRQLIGSQCSGAMVLKRLGLIEDKPVCADVITRPHLEAQGVTVLDKSFYADGNIASAGGCLASQYLAAWVILRTVGQLEMTKALESVAPVGEEITMLNRVFETVTSSAKVLV
jgi:transcriptional regulator GlxA family with amidase domain